MLRLLRGAVIFLSFPAGVFAQSPLSVINGARFEIRYPISPGAYAQAYGTFPGVAAATAGSVPLPTELGGVRVLVNDMAAPLYAVGPAAVSFVIPKAAAAGRATVRVVHGSDTVGSGSADVVPVSPGIFFVVGDPLAQGGILNQQSTYAIQSAPARRGQVIQIFATGQGAVDAEVADGAVPTGGLLARARGVTKVFISVDEAQVTFSGLSPQFPGLWQINAVVPDKPYISGQTPLVVTVDGVPSNQVSFWVAQ
jgi:uncharacterized protein (TIGR03437 family)